MTRRVAITGLDAVTPIGIGVQGFWRGLREGALGIGPITRFDPAAVACRVAAEVRGFEPALHLSELLTPVGRFAQFGMAAAHMAYDDAGLRAASGFAPCVASGASAVPEFQEVLERLRGSRCAEVTPRPSSRASGTP